ncbi:hypothetical protein [Prauserella alba]|uniref:KOW motif-containing protein n=1 Tax=Prauserella alba TaxID=176898 RepID=A0ABN1VFB3_9PSEU|nr:hypothetical protein [Prauserella alba]MCP2180035.1 hypothetical protein [Prauserella alba]
MSLDYIRRHYGVPAKRGSRVVVDGLPGTITGFRDQYLLVRLDHEPRRLQLAHATWHLQYPPTTELEN